MVLEKSFLLRILVIPRMNVVMTIAGSDSGGGAGIQADLKTFAAFGVHGTCAITSVTAQNTRGVQRIFEVPASVVAEQIKSVAEDMKIEYAKTGMLASADIIKAVALQVKKYKIPLVVDPVVRAHSSASLINENGISFLKEKLLPLAKVVTPNIYEASLLSGVKIRSRKDAIAAAKEILEMGADAVVVKGGHLDGTDIFYDGRVRLIPGRLIKKNVHGAGCTFSAALTAELALGSGCYEAAVSASNFARNSIASGQKVGRGLIPVDQMRLLVDASDRYAVLVDVENAVNMVEKSRNFAALVPEVGTNIGMAIPGATDTGDVAAVSGRIVKVNGKARAVGGVRFGASSHVARIILAAIKFDSDKRAAVNIRYGTQILKACKKLNLRVASFSRERVPDRMTLNFGVAEAVRASGEVPDVIYDIGDIGKEPMVRLIGRSATEVVSRAIDISEHIPQTGGD